MLSSQGRGHSFMRRHFLHEIYTWLQKKERTCPMLVKRRLLQHRGTHILMSIQKSTLSCLWLSFSCSDCTTYPSSGSEEAAKILTGLLREVCGLITEVETLARLVIVVPVSSSEAESSFRSLVSLKSWQRWIMIQNWQFYGAVFHIHQHKLDILQFISDSQTSLGVQCFVVEKCLKKDKGQKKK